MNDEPRSYKPQVQVHGEGLKWIGNGLAFPTYQEALDNAEALSFRWTLVMGFRAVPSHETPNYRWVDGQLESIK